MSRATDASPLALVGLEPSDERLYRALLRGSGRTREELAEATGLSPRDLDDVVARFTRAGLVHELRGVVTAVPPERALEARLADESARVQAASERLDSLRNLLPSLVSEYLASRQRTGAGVDVQAVSSADALEVLKGLEDTSTGELLWMRPDQWRLPAGGKVDAWVRGVIASGRTSRALYPARVLEEAPDAVRARAEAGEHVRIVASVPTRLAVLGSAALVPERWGENTGRLLVVREHALVGALTALFEGMWERAMTVPGFDAHEAAPGERGLRGLLLHQLAQGAKDEQIARALGLSLRTVRRRVADLMDDLGAESRFQAGVEAVRRGWI